MQSRKKAGGSGYWAAIYSAAVFILFQGCVTTTPPRFMLLPNEPMAKSDELAYPEIEEIYASDTNLVVLGYAGVPKVGPYRIRLALQNALGKEIYMDETNVQARGFKGKVIFYYKKVVALSQELKAEIKEGNVTVRLSLDGQPLYGKTVRYTPQSIMIPGGKPVVILPFYSSTQETFRYGYKEEILNTFSDAVYCEIKRFMPAVTPHYVAEQKLSDLETKGCLEDPACRERLKAIFGDGIFIVGDASVPRYENQDPKLRLLVFDTQTGTLKEFKDWFSIGGGGYIEDMMKRMLQKTLRELTAYLHEIR